MSIAARASGVSVMSDVLDDEWPAGLARPAVAARTIIEAVTHLLRAQWLAAMVTPDRWMKIVAAFVVFEDQRRLTACKPIVAPAQHRDQRAVEILTLFGQRILITLGQILIFATVQDSFCDQPVESVGQDVRSDAKLVLRVVEAPYTEERFTNDHETPAVANHFQRLRHRTWSAAVEYGRVRRTPVAFGVNDRCCARARPVPIGHGFVVDLFLAMRAGDHRPAYFATKIVNEIDRRFSGFL